MRKSGVRGKKRSPLSGVTLSLCCIVAVAMLASVAVHAEDRVARGSYLVTVLGCGDCHTPGSFLGKPDLAHKLSGGDVGFGGPAGTVWGPNLTPDEQTGLGLWSVGDIVTALRTGVSRHGRHLAPAMPYSSYAALTDEDAGAVAAYLKSLPPTRNAVPAPVPPGGTAKAPYMTIVFPK